MGEHADDAREAALMEEADKVGRKPMTEPTDAFAKAKAEGFREGQEAMKREASKYLGDYLVPMENHPARRYLISVTEAIRALEIKESPDE